MAEHTPERKQTLDDLAALRAGLVLQPHPGIEAAFDLAKAALVRAIRDEVYKKFPKPETEITRRMLRAMMDAGFMIMHRDEFQDTILVVAQVKKVFDKEDAALGADASTEGGVDA